MGLILPLGLPPVLLTRKLRPLLLRLPAIVLVPALSSGLLSGLSVLLGPGMRLGCLPGVALPLAAGLGGSGGVRGHTIWLPVCLGSWAVGLRPPSADLLTQVSGPVCSRPLLTGPCLPVWCTIPALLGPLRLALGLLLLALLLLSLLPGSRVLASPLPSWARARAIVGLCSLPLASLHLPGLQCL